MSAFSSIAFEPILRYAGFFWTKVTMALLTTGGAVLLAFYSENNDVIIWAWNLMGFPSVMYIIINTNEQAPRFPSISGLTIGRDTRKSISGQKSIILIENRHFPSTILYKGLVSGLYDASAGIFLTFKFMYDADLGITLTEMLVGFACATALIWIKLFFFMPYKEFDESRTAFESSVFGQFCNKSEKSVEPVADECAKNDEIIENKKEKVPLTNSILTINYFLANIFFIVMTVRINSFPS